MTYFIEIPLDNLDTVSDNIKVYDNLDIFSAKPKCDKTDSVSDLSSNHVNRVSIINVLGENAI